MQCVNLRRCLLRQRAVKRISGRPLDPVQVDIILHLFGTEAGGDSLDPDRFAQVLLRSGLLSSGPLRVQQCETAFASSYSSA